MPQIETFPFLHKFFKVKMSAEIPFGELRFGITVALRLLFFDFSQYFLPTFLHFLSLG